MGNKKHKEWTARQKKQKQKNKTKQNKTKTTTTTKKKNKNKNKRKKPDQADKFCFSQAGFIPIETGNGEGK